jgi:hypothetical protein
LKKLDLKGKKSNCRFPFCPPPSAGHIKFWKMAHTFTGLKLQGEIGKFGRIEISDIAGYAELPDRKVLPEPGFLWGGVQLDAPGSRPTNQQRTHCDSK